MSVGLDLSTTQFCSLQRAGDELISRQCDAVYVVLSDTSGHRRLLGQANVKFAECGHDLILFGETAMEWADMLNLPIVSLLPEGRVPQNDPVARQLLALMVDAVLPTPTQTNQICCLALPGGHDLSKAFCHYDVRFFQQLVSLKGYVPRLISAGHSVILADLEDTLFSGLGVSLGPSDCEFVIVHTGRELGYCSTEGVGPQANNLTSGLNPSSLAMTLADLEASFFKVLSEAKDHFINHGLLRFMKQPVRVHCAGPVTQLDDFLTCFTKAWQAVDWPIAVHHIDRANDARFAVARGCLIQATLQSEHAVSHAA
jgi:hypothetical protein